MVSYINSGGSLFYNIKYKMQYFKFCLAVLALQIYITRAQNQVRPDPHLIGDNSYTDSGGSSFQCDTVIQCIDNDGRPNTPGATYADPYTSTGSVIVGGWTKSKDMVWAHQDNQFPIKDIPPNKPTGCYEDTTYSCGATSDLAAPLKGVAFVYKAGYQEGNYDQTSEIVWQKYFENYQGVTAVALSRSERSLEGAYGQENTWNTGSSQWEFDPQPTPIYTNFVAAFLESKCLEQRSHKIVTFDYANGEILQAYPWRSRQEVYKHQFLFQYIGASTTIGTTQVLSNGATPVVTGTQINDIYQYAIFLASNFSSGPGTGEDQFEIYRYQAVAKSTTAATPANAGTSGSFSAKSSASQWTQSSTCLTGNPSSPNYLCQGHSFEAMDITLAKDDATVSGSGRSVTEEASFGRHRKLTGANVTDSYNVEVIKLFQDPLSSYKYGPQSMVQMDKHIYVGGAVKPSSGAGTFCPVIAKITTTCEDILTKWPSTSTAFTDLSGNTCAQYNAGLVTCGSLDTDTFKASQACITCRLALTNDDAKSPCSSFRVRWAYQTNQCTSAGNNANSHAVDILYADHLNDRVYGLIVPRTLAGALVATNYYRILITNGNGDESADVSYSDSAQTTANIAGHPRFASNCKNRIQIVNVQMENTDTNTYYWRPMGLTVYQEFNRASAESEFTTTEVHVVFRPLKSTESAKLGTNEFGSNNRNSVTEATAGHISSTALDVHILSNSISDKLFQCNPSATNIGELLLPKRTTDVTAGAATFERQNFGQSAYSTVQTSTTDRQGSNIFINDLSFTQPSSKSFIYGGSVVKSDSTKKRGAIFNAGATDAQYDTKYFDNTVTADTHGSTLHQMTHLTNGILVTQFGYDSVTQSTIDSINVDKSDASSTTNWETTMWTDTSKFDCTSSMRYYKCKDEATGGTLASPTNGNGDVMYQVYQNVAGDDCSWYEIPDNQKNCNWGIQGNGFNPSKCCACGGGTVTDALYNGDSLAAPFVNDLNKSPNPALTSTPFAVDQGLATSGSCGTGGAGPCGLFVDEYWDDHSFALKESAQSEYISWWDYMSNHGRHLSYTSISPVIYNKNELDGCGKSECSIKQYNMLDGTCTTNYTDALYLDQIPTYSSTADTDRRWLIRMSNYTQFNSGVNPWTSWDGKIEINRYAQTEFRIWICVSCHNDFQQVKTMPFMVDVQCSRSSTQLSLPWHLLTLDTTGSPIAGNYNPNRAVGLGTNGYNPYTNTTQTFEATIVQNSQTADVLLPSVAGTQSIYYEFLPFNSSNSACPIIQYRVKDVKVVLHNHKPDTLNYKYGRHKTNQTCLNAGLSDCNYFIYEMRQQDQSNSLCTSYSETADYTTSTHKGTACVNSLEPKNDNNTVQFNKFNAINSGTLGVVGFSADDIDQYDDEDQTSLKKNGSMHANSKAYQYSVNGKSVEEVINQYDPADYYETLSYTGSSEGAAQINREHSIGNDQVPYYNDESMIASNLERSSAWPFRKDSQILHVLDCTAYPNNENNDGTRVSSGVQKMVTDATAAMTNTQCSRPVPPTDAADIRHERTFTPVYQADGTTINNFRLYVYDTRIIQEIHFNIEALAEGGRRLEAQNLILNITCPGNVEVYHPDFTTHGVQAPGLTGKAFNDDVSLYIGGGGNQHASRIVDAQYTFPAFYPTFEQCNFITGYAVAKSVGATTYRNQTSAYGYDLGSVEAPDSMWLTDDLSRDRQPNVKQTIQVDTSCVRQFEYTLLIEVQLTQNTWTEFIYFFANPGYSDVSVTAYKIQVKLGGADPGGSTPTYINPDVDYNGTAAVILAGTQKNPFPDSTYNSILDLYNVQIHLDDQNLIQLAHNNLTTGVYYYKFEYFWCKNIGIEGSGILSQASFTSNTTTCNYYNISSSNTEIVPIVNYNNSYTLEFDEMRHSYWDADMYVDAAGNFVYPVHPHRYRHYIKIDTTQLRNISSGTAYEFYIYAAYNNDATDADSTGQYAAFSKKVAIDIICGLEEVSVGIKEYAYDLPEGTAEEFFGNQTFTLNPDNLTLSSSQSKCPFVKFELFEFENLTNPWVNTSMIQLHNSENPYSAYIDVTTYEEERVTWVKHFYLKATTLGGKTNQNDPIHFKITIVERFNDQEVDHAPIFSSHIIHPTIRVWERDLILGNTSVYQYWSPPAVDNENDPITIRSQYVNWYPYMDLRIFDNDTFYYIIDREKLNYLDDGRHHYEIKLVDDDQLAQSNRKWVKYYFDVVYNELNPRQYYYFTYPDIEERKFDFANITSIQIECPLYTWTNSTGVRNLCKDIQDSRLDPPRRIETNEITNVVFQNDQYSQRTDYHYAWITNPSCDFQNYQWNNKAGISWSLTAVYRDDQIIAFAVGEDSAYYSDGYTEAKIKYSSQNPGQIEGIYGPGDELFTAYNQFAIEFDYLKNDECLSVDHTSRFEYVTKQNQIFMPVEFLRDAEFIRFGVNFTALTNLISARNYSLSPEIIHETFGTTLIRVNATIPTNYTCHQSNCGNLQYLTYTKTLTEFNEFIVPSLNDSIAFIAEKLLLTDRPMFIDEDLEIDTRPAPSFEGFSTYSNSTVEIRFNQPVQFWDSTANVSQIEEALNKYLMIWIEAGADGSQYLSNNVEEIEYEALDDPTENAECRAFRLLYGISCTEYDIIWKDFNNKKNNISLENQDIIQQITDQAQKEFLVQMVSLAYYMTPELLNNYISDLKPTLSSIIYEQTEEEGEGEEGEEGEEGAEAGTDAESEPAPQRRALRNYGFKRPILEDPYEIYDQKENERSEAESLKFRVKYVSTNESSIWLSLQFEQFENINMGSAEGDQLQLKFLDLRFIVSVDTLKPVLSDNYRLSTITGQKYYFGLIDKMSFYFEDYDDQKYGKTGPHMSFSHIWAQTGLRLLDKSSPPKKVFFEKPDYDIENRIFTGTIMWGENTFQDAARWEFRMRFAQDLLTVESGKWVWYDINDHKIQTLYFDENFLHKLYMKPDYDLYIEDIPPLDPADSEEYDETMIDFQYKFRIMILVFQALGLAQNLPFRKRSSQGLWAMTNSMAIIGHTSLFVIPQTPGNVYRQLRYLMNFYNFKQRSSFPKFTIRDAYNRYFMEMGYFTTNFIPLQFNGAVTCLSLVGVLILVIILRKMSQDNYKNRGWRLLGLYLPDKYLFRRAFFRIFVVFYLQILMTAILGVITLDDIKSEFPQKCSTSDDPNCVQGRNKSGEEKTVLNGLSAVLALVMIIVVVPLIAHMVYIITFFFKFLQEDDIKEKYGHYYQDIDTSTMMKSYYYVFFFIRRILLVCIIFFFSDSGSLQLVSHFALSFAYLIYLVGVKPFQNMYDNIQEIVNEATVNLLAIIHFSFMYMVNPSEFTSKLILLNGKTVWYYRQYDAGHAYVTFLIIFLFLNLLYVIFSTFLENYRLSSGYIMVWQKIHELERKLEDEIKFKKIFTDENSRNFMISFEIERQRKVLELRKAANTFHWDKYIKGQEISWLKKIGVKSEEIIKIFPDYQPTPQKNMYLQEVIQNTKNSLAKGVELIDMKAKANINGSQSHRTAPALEANPTLQQAFQHHGERVKQENEQLKKKELFEAPPKKEVINVEQAVKKIKSINPQKKKKKQPSQQNGMGANLVAQGENMSAINEQPSHEQTLENEISGRQDISNRNAPTTNKRGHVYNALSNDVDYDLSGKNQLERDILEFERQQSEIPQIVKSKSKKSKSSKPNVNLLENDAEDDWEAQFMKEAQKADKLSKKKLLEEKESSRKGFATSQTKLSGYEKGVKNQIKLGEEEDDLESQRRATQDNFNRKNSISQFNDGSNVNNYL